MLRFGMETDHGPMTVEMDAADQHMLTGLEQLAQKIHRANAQWWEDINTGAPLDRNTGELLMLVTSELSEALEAHRKKRKDDHLPEFDGFETEIMDAFIRLFDIAAGRGLNFKTLFAKLAYNANRQDHKKEHRLAEGGKAY